MYVRCKCRLACLHMLYATSNYTLAHKCARSILLLHILASKSALAPSSHKKKNCENSSFLKAPTRFELVITVLQTGALPLGYGAISDSDGNRTRVTAVKGRCLNRLTTEPRPRALR